MFDVSLEEWGQAWIFFAQNAELQTYPLLSSPNMFGYAVSFKEMLVLVVAGQRGAMGMSLALAVMDDTGTATDKRIVPAPLRFRIAFYVAGIMTLTSIINVLLVSPVYLYLKIYRKKQEDLEQVGRFLELVQEDLDAHFVKYFEKHWLMGSGGLRRMVEGEHFLNLGELGARMRTEVIARGPATALDTEAVIDGYAKEFLEGYPERIWSADLDEGGEQGSAVVETGPGVVVVDGAGPTGGGSSADPAGVGMGIHLRIAHENETIYEVLLNEGKNEGGNGNGSAAGSAGDPANGSGGYARRRAATAAFHPQQSRDGSGAAIAIRSRPQRLRKVIGSMQHLHFHLHNSSSPGAFFQNDFFQSPGGWEATMGQLGRVFFPHMATNSCGGLG